MGRDEGVGDAVPVDCDVRVGVTLNGAVEDDVAVPDDVAVDVAGGVAVDDGVMSEAMPRPWKVKLTTPPSAASQAENTLARMPLVYVCEGISWVTLASR